jgi:hypothetical protein
LVPKAKSTAPNKTFRIFSLPDDFLSSRNKPASAKKDTNQELFENGGQLTFLKLVFESEILVRSFGEAVTMFSA